MIKYDVTNVNVTSNARYRYKVNFLVSDSYLEP